MKKERLLELAGVELDEASVQLDVEIATNALKAIRDAHPDKADFRKLQWYAETALEKLGI